MEARGQLENTHKEIEEIDFLRWEVLKREIDWGDLAVEDVLGLEDEIHAYEKGGIHSSVPYEASGYSRLIGSCGVNTSPTVMVRLTLKSISEE